MFACDESCFKKLILFIVKLIEDLPILNDVFNLQISRFFRHTIFLVR